MDVEFRTPPEKAQRKPRSHWHHLARALQERPGEWAVATMTNRDGTAPDGSPGRRYAYNPHRSSSAFRPVEDYESVHRTEGDLLVIYMRYVGHLRESQE